LSRPGQYIRHRRPSTRRETSVMCAALSCRPFRLACLILLLGVAPSARGDDGRFSSIRSGMQAFVDQGELAGAVSLVGRKDGILSYEAVGSLNLETKQPMPKDAVFRIASMTKPITAIGIMVLVDEGKLSVDDPVEKHQPGFRGQMLVADRAKDTV